MSEEKKKHFITILFDRVFSLGRLKLFNLEISFFKGFKTNIELYEDKKEDGK